MKPEVLLPDYAKAHVLVVGDIMLDRYWAGVSTRISPEAPVPVVQINHTHALPGASGNVARNIASLGAQAALLTMTGEDAFATQLEDLLRHERIQPFFQKITGLSTVSKLRVLSHHQQLIRLDFDQDFSNVSSETLLACYQKNLHAFQIVVLSDYAKGTLRCAPELIHKARKAGLPVLIDPKGRDYSVYKNAYLLTPNRQEFESVAGVCKDDTQLVEKALGMIRDLNLQALLITRGEEGMTLIRPSHPPLHLGAEKKEIYDVTGAGDTVMGVLSASLAAGSSLEHAVKLANICAALVVSKLGASVVKHCELEKALSFSSVNSDLNPAHANPLALPEKIIDEDALLDHINALKARGKTFVMTNGCFDILHPGHVAYLEEAKKLGDYLIVAVNTDASVKKLKGSARPVNTLSHRMAILAGLASVDWIVAFDEDTPEHLIKKLQPYTLVKGGDYQADAVAGAKAVMENGGRVKIIDFLPGYSTTQIIKQIQNTQNIPAE